jgi:uncharacterized protein (DUF2267 family)
MSTTGLDVFERTIHKTNAWLKELMQELATESRHDAYVALRAVLHALRDRLPVEEVAQLGAQLPMLIRGMYYEGWDPTDKPVRERRLEGFLAGMAVELPNDVDDPEPVARAVFSVLAKRVSEGEIEDIKQLLPTPIRELWP